MPNLHVRGVPEELYQLVQKLAASQNRSLSAQVVTMLESAVKQEQARLRQVRVLEGIRRRRFRFPSGIPRTDSVAELREVRGSWD